MMQFPDFGCARPPIPDTPSNNYTRLTMAKEYHNESQEPAPGPWRLLVSMPLEFRIVADTWKGELTICKGECLYRHSARMMAAAPELLAALKEADACMSGLYDGTDVQSRIRAAIASATPPQE